MKQDTLPEEVDRHCRLLRSALLLRLCQEPNNVPVLDISFVTAIIELFALIISVSLCCAGLGRVVISSLSFG